jgi:HEPN domain-containing protein
MKPADTEVARKVQQWLAFGDEDLRMAQHAFSLAGPPPYRLIAYHAQQCAEKYLKAYLVLHGIHFPYTHDLSRLLELCAEQAGWAEELREAEELTPYAITARYPGEDEEVREEEARRAAEIAARVRDVVRRTLAAEGFALTQRS